MRESFGLMSDGTLLGSPWAIDKHGRPLDDIWVLGNLAEQSMVEILASPRVARLREQIAEADLDEEGEAFGQCKIQSFIYGESADPLERMFEAADPLYSPQLSRGAADIADTEHGDPEHGDPENGGAAHDDAARDNAAENHAAA
jgi:hypothetical protein